MESDEENWHCWFNRPTSVQSILNLFSHNLGRHFQLASNADWWLTVNADVDDFERRQARRRFDDVQRDFRRRCKPTFRRWRHVVVVARARTEQQRSGAGQHFLVPKPGLRLVGLHIDRRADGQPSGDCHWIFFTSLQDCHHSGGSFIYWAHVASLTCEANVQSTNSSHSWINFVTLQITRGRVDHSILERSLLLWSLIIVD